MLYGIIEHNSVIEIDKKIYEGFYINNSVEIPTFKGGYIMTIEQRKLWSEGRKLWQEYINVNGYSFTFNDIGIKKLSKLLDLNQKYIKERLTIYLDN